MKVICVNSDGWEFEGNRRPGPECGHEYQVIDEEDGFYEVSEFPGELYPKEEFIHAGDPDLSEEKTLSKVFSH